MPRRAPRVYSQSSEVGNSTFLKRHSGKIDLPARKREDALKQRRCLEALQAYFAEARNTIKLIRQHQKKPGSIAEHLQILAQRDREAEAQRRYLQARKLLFQAANVSCLPGRNQRGRGLSDLNERASMVRPE
jgi:hypothetical protein